MKPKHVVYTVFGAIIGLILLRTRSAESSELAFSILLWVAIAAVAVLALFVGVVIAYRLAKPKSAAASQQQQEINKRYPADAKKTGRLSISRDWLRDNKGHVFALALIMQAIVVLTLGDAWLPISWIRHTPPFATIRDWVWDGRYLALIMAAGIIALVLKIELSEKDAKTGTGIILGILGFLFLFTALSTTWYGSMVLEFLGVPVAHVPMTRVTEEETMPARMPLASGPGAKMAQVMMAPLGKSIRFPVLKLSRPIVKGNGFEVHCLYQPDGADKTSSLPDRCPEDPEIYEMYLVDTSGRTNYPWYGYQLK